MNNNENLEKPTDELEKELDALDLDSLLEKANDDPDEEVRKRANRNLYQRTKKAEANRKEQPPEPPVKKEPETPAAPSTDEIDTVLELQAEGYSPAEVKQLRDYSRKMKIPLADILKDPIIKGGFEAQRKKAKVEGATPTPSSRSQNVGSQKYSEAKTLEERKAAFDEMTGKGGEE